MKPLFISLLILFCFGVSAQINYYVSNDGDDANPGTLDKPFLTISKAANSMVSGDFCYLRAGTYREKVVVNKSGLSFANYNNEFVLINGCDLVSGWVKHEGNIYKAKVESEVLQVFVNHERMHLARFPNEDGDMLNRTDWMPSITSLISKENTGIGQVIFPGMESNIDNYWVGATYLGTNGPNPFSATNGKIKSSSGNTIQVTDLNYWWKNGGAPASIGEGRGYIINHLNALDAPKEWYWNNAELYLYSPGGGSPEGAFVEVRTRIWGFDISRQNNISIKGLHFKAASILMDKTTNSLIENCFVRYPAPFSKHYFENGHDYGDKVDGSSGIYVGGSNNTIRSCYVAHSWCNGITLDGNHNTVENCIIEDIGWLARRMHPIQCVGTDNKILNNTIGYCSQSGIDGGNRLVGYNKYGLRMTIKNNYIHDIGMMLTDCGFFYINVQGQEPRIDSEIAYNKCFRNHSGSHAFGIYLDNGTSGASIHHNLVFGGPNMMYSIFLHGSRGGCSDISVYNNTIWNTATAAICVHNGGLVDNVIIKNNHAQQGGFIVFIRKVDEERGDFVNNAIIDHNRTNVSDEELVDVANEDFRLKNAQSPSVDAGVDIPGITNCKTGIAPDLGAYEFGGCDWEAGSKLVLPEFLDEKGVHTASLPLRLKHKRTELNKIK